MNSKQLTLGQLLEKLEAIEPKHYDVVFDFGGLIPDYFESYRGDYSHVCLNFEMPYKNWEYTPSVNVHQMIEKVKDTIGEYKSGWKGGDYFMHEDTPVWVALGGMSPGSYLHDVKLSGCRIYLVTRNIIEDA